MSYDFDYIVIGSGFGGSVSAHRLTEKGYSVAVMEMGRRWKAEDFPKTNWDARRWLWRAALTFQTTCGTPPAPARTTAGTHE